MTRNGTLRKAPSVLAIAILAGLASLALSGCAGYRYGAEVEIGNAPPPPHLSFHSRPHYSVVSGVYVVDHDDFDADCDVFQYGGTWYAYYEGYWYRARTYNGPYAVVQIQSVPERIFRVPAGRWKHNPHGGPPGQQKKRDRDRGRGYDWES